MMLAQGGIALLHGQGYFAGPDYTGMEESYDKIEMNPYLGETKPWDFSRYTPHVVIVAFGQNDANPVELYGRRTMRENRQNTGERNTGNS